jgi:3(or 17)beta-hydroxysteroid dehydrogenase
MAVRGLAGLIRQISKQNLIDWTPVNSIHPGTSEIEMGDQVLVMRARDLGTNDIEEARRQALARLPIGRMGTVTDIVKGIVFLASDDAAFMTGAGLVVDGGITAQ